MMYPIYAFIARLILFIPLSLLIIFLVKNIYGLDSIFKKVVSAVFIAVFVCTTIYVTFIKNNTCRWKCNNPERTIEKILSIATADIDIYNDTDYSEIEDVQRPVIYVSKLKTGPSTDKQKIISSAFGGSLIQKNKSFLFNGEDYSILIEPAFGTRFLTTPTGMYESDIQVFIEDEHIVLHIIENQKYTFLQPLMNTSPEHDDILELLNLAEVRKGN